MNTFLKQFDDLRGKCRTHGMTLVGTSKGREVSPDRYISTTQIFSNVHLREYLILHQIQVKTEVSMVKIANQPAT